MKILGACWLAWRCNMVAHNLSKLFLSVTAQEPSYTVRRHRNAGRLCGTPSQQACENYLLAFAGQAQRCKSIVASLVFLLHDNVKGKDGFLA